MRVVLRVDEDGGLLTIDGLCERAVEKGVIDIELMNWPLVGKCHGEESTHGVRVL